MSFYKWNDEELGKLLEYRLYRIGSITEKEFSDIMADRLSKREIMWKYSKALQEVQRERNALRAENEKLKQQLAEKESEYFVIYDVRSAKYLDIEFDDFYSGFGELSGATIFDDELYNSIKNTKYITGGCVKKPIFFGQIKSIKEGK